MKTTKTANKRINRRHKFNASLIRLILGLCVVLGVSSISVRAADSLAQATARVALEQKMSKLDHSQALLALPVTSSKVVVGRPGGCRSQHNRDSFQNSGDSANRPGASNSDGCIRCCRIRCCRTCRRRSS